MGEGPTSRRTQVSLQHILPLLPTLSSHMALFLREASVPVGTRNGPHRLIPVYEHWVLGGKALCGEAIESLGCRTLLEEAVT